MPLWIWTRYGWWGVHWPFHRSATQVQPCSIILDTPRIDAVWVHVKDIDDRHSSWSLLMSNHGPASTWCQLNPTRCICRLKCTKLNYLHIGMALRLSGQGEITCKHWRSWDKLEQYSIMNAVSCYSWSTPAGWVVIESKFLICSLNGIVTKSLTSIVSLLVMKASISSKKKNVPQPGTAQVHQTLFLAINIPRDGNKTSAYRILRMRMRFTIGVCASQLTRA